ncbi:MAG: hypothetical protein R2873_12460 [Caldilineaceae bacterium]
MPPSGTPPKVNLRSDGARSTPQSASHLRNPAVDVRSRGGSRCPH